MHKQVFRAGGPVNAGPLEPLAYHWSLASQSFGN